MIDRTLGRRLILLAGCIIICEAAGILGSFATTPAIPVWYESLYKPFFTPPNWLFAPVWTFLYALMGVSLFLVLRRGWSDLRVRKSVVIFGAHLVVNVAWSWFFFGMRSPSLGFAAIILVIVLIVAVIISFFNLSRIAAGMLTPYLLWVMYAAALNLSIWILNR